MLLHCDIPVPESFLLGLPVVFVGIQLELFVCSTAHLVSVLLSCKGQMLVAMY